MKEKFKEYIKKYYLVYIIIAVLVAIDLITKALLNDVNITIIENVLTLIATENYGGAFSMLSNNTVVLTIFSAIFIVIIVVFDKFCKFQNKLYKVAYSMILSGAIGNLFDRICFGYVRDFIRIDLFDFTGINTVFNFADICITFGVVLMVIFFISYWIKEKKKKDDKTV